MTEKLDEDIISKESIAEEGVAFISKPISPEELLRKINLALRNSAGEWNLIGHKARHAL